jgi:hypothetical protein
MRQKIPNKLKVTFQIQKNRQNDQIINLVADNNHLDICLAQSAWRILLRAKRLGQSNSQPMGMLVNKFGIMRYPIGNRISDDLCSIARAVHLDMPED